MRGSELKLRTGLAAARLHRHTLRRVTFIGVTGSCGKTTTKELIAAALRSELPGRASPGQGNGLAVVAKTILRTTNRDAFCVIEIATGKPGHVERMSRLVRPRIAVVTNVGGDHRSVFRTLAATASEKRALVDCVGAEGTAVLNADDPYVMLMAERFEGRVITFGRSSGADLRAECPSSSWPEPLSFTLRTRDRSLPIHTKLHGKHWTTSVLAALGVAVAMNVPVECAIEALRGVDPVPGRMRPVPCNGITFIQDDVKAPFWSLDAALEFLADARAPRKVAVIGTLSDFPGSLRKYSTFARRALAVADRVVFIGPNAEHALRARAHAPSGVLEAFPTIAEADPYLRATLRTGDLVLLKGSKKVDNLTRIMSAWEADMKIGSGVPNVGGDHRSAFRSLEATAAEKRQLVEAVVDGGRAVLNGLVRSGVTARRRR